MMKKITIIIFSIFILFNCSIAFADFENLCFRDVIMYNEEEVSAVYLFRKAAENPEFIVLKNNLKKEFLDEVSTIVVNDSNDNKTVVKIEFEINNALPRVEIYNSDFGFTEVKGGKINKYINWDEIEHILQNMNIQWKNLSGVDFYEPNRQDTLPSTSDNDKSSKTYEMNILNQNGIIIGDPDGNLRESDEITRAEFSTILCRAMGCETEANTDDLKQKNYFPDVPPEHWAAGYINFAYENKAISGFPDGKFYPEQPVTNEQVIKMLIAAWGYGEEAEQNGGYPNGYMKIAKEHGVLDSIEFNYANASKRWVASIFVYGVLSMPSENEEIKQPIKTEISKLGDPRKENDKYIERPEETLKNVTEESLFYERTVFEQLIPNDYLPIKIDGKTITNVWYRDFSIAINNYDVSKESFDSELSVGKSLDFSDFTNGEYDIVVGYNDGKINDYSFGKITISDEKMYLLGRMQRYTALQDSVKFEESNNEIALSNEVVADELPFEIKASSNGKDGYVLCINYSGSLIDEQELRYSINDIDIKEINKYERFTAPKDTIEPIVIHDLNKDTEYILSVSFLEKMYKKL